jgi:hypothetical protein
MRQFILDKTPNVEESLTLDGTKYSLKTLGKNRYVFEIYDSEEPETVYLTKTELKAMFLLISTDK